ncbi:MAG: putative RNA methyltransferase [Thermoanaerobaculia bacterium]
MPLRREERRMVCENAHSFDVARSGYVNLLQPQDKRSKRPGDSTAAVNARRKFLDAGYEQPLTNAIIAMMRGAPAPSPALDAGCGEGHHLGNIQRELGVEAHGIDLSTAAIDLAARRYPECQWIVANADRFLPYADASFATVLSITGRLNAPEFRRVIRSDGRLVVAVAAPDDLSELREIIYGEAVERDRADRTAQLFAEHFDLQKSERVTSRVTLDRESIVNVLTSTYRGVRNRERERLANIEELDVTLSRDVLLFVPRS